MKTAFDLVKEALMGKSLWWILVLIPVGTLWYSSLVDSKKQLEKTTEITHKQEDKIEFLIQMNMITLREDLKKQYDKARNNPKDFKPSDIDKLNVQCSLSKKYNYGMDDEVEFLCAKIKEIDLNIFKEEIETPTKKEKITMVMTNLNK